MILFIGDFVRLHDEEEWLAVTDIEPYDICVLQNGIRVCASEEYIAEAKSCNEFMAASKNNKQSRPWPRGH
jgi:hypothetical protein